MHCQATKRSPVRLSMVFPHGNRAQFCARVPVDLGSGGIPPATPPTMLAPQTVLRGFASSMLLRAWSTNDFGHKRSHTRPKHHGAQAWPTRFTALRFAPLSWPSLLPVSPPRTPSLVRHRVRGSIAANTPCRPAGSRRTPSRAPRPCSPSATQTPTQAPLVTLRYQAPIVRRSVVLRAARRGAAPAEPPPPCLRYNVPRAAPRGPRTACPTL